MPLFVVATPIGNPQDFSLRALQALKEADLIIGEEMKVLRQTLKAAGVQGTTLEQLNEHSTPADIAHFTAECAAKKVALVSDCGTPGFCDPGADLVRACAQKGIEVRAVPGPSSLMTLLSVCGERVDQFVFHGFLPAKSEAREQALRDLKREKRALIVMETPYRAERLFTDLGTHFAERRCVVGWNLTAENEQILRGRGREIAAHAPKGDGEPIALILPG
jgi:16S rRNA (cytidine1402-2'-O)-methyltransferase